MTNSQSQFPTIFGLAANDTSGISHPLLSAVYQSIKSSEQERETNAKLLYQCLESTLGGALNHNNPEDLKAIHLALDEILRLRFDAHNMAAERSPVLFKVQQQIIEQVFAKETANLQIEVPDTGDEFKEWFVSKLSEYQQSPHPVFNYLEEEVGLEGFKYFISQEAGVHVAFDDVLAFAQVGTRGDKKSEFFENLQDEMGSGDPDKFHLSMFGKLLGDLGIERIKKEELSWQALSCGNYMMFLSSFRSFYPECIGYLGFLEALTPGRFSKIAKAGIRLGLSEDAMAYHAEHSELDIEHAEGWVDHIIVPEIQANPVIAKQIVTGVLIRESISRTYWDELYRGTLEADGHDVKVAKDFDGKPLEPGMK